MNWSCTLVGATSGFTQLDVVADNRLDAEVAAIKEADALFPDEAPWRCTRSRVEECWHCDRPGVHQGVVPKMQADLRVMFCDEHRPENDGFGITVHIFDLS